jgi:hypothetical protein
MSGRQVGFEDLEVAGITLVVLGIFVLYRDMAGAVASFRNFLSHSSALGTVPAAILAISQTLHELTGNAGVSSLMERALATSWPMLLVVLGKAMTGTTWAK